jgi:cobalt-zinc-cadmium efflux system outer membrane protein
VRAEQGPARSLPSPAMLTLDRLLETAMSRRPDLARMGHQVSQTESMARLAQREAIPNLGIGALLTGGDSQSGTGIGLQVSLPIPLWNRNQGLVEEREAGVRQATLQREAVSLAVRSGVTDALQAYEVASDEEALFENRVLAPARRNQDLLEIAYREGELGLPSLVLLRNQLLDAELGYWDAWLARRLSYTQLEAAVGSFDLDLTNPDVGRVQ